MAATACIAPFLDIDMRVLWRPQSDVRVTTPWSRHCARHCSPEGSCCPAETQVGTCPSSGFGDTSRRNAASGDDCDAPNPFCTTPWPVTYAPDQGEVRSARPHATCRCVTIPGLASHRRPSEVGASGLRMASPSSAQSSRTYAHIFRLTSVYALDQPPSRRHQREPDWCDAKKKKAPRLPVSSTQALRPTKLAASVSFSSQQGNSVVARLENGALRDKKNILCGPYVCMHLRGRVPVLGYKS